MSLSLFAAPAGMATFTFAMVYAGLMDLTTMKIRNGLVLSLFLAYLVLAPLAAFSAAEIAWSVVVAGGVLVLSFTLFALGWIGGGDAKLAAVTALWFGVDHTLTYLLYAAVLGAALTLGLVVFRMHFLPAWLQKRAWIARLHSQDSGVPYGVAMALAGLVVFPETRWMTAFS